MGSVVGQLTPGRGEQAPLPRALGEGTGEREAVARTTHGAVRHESREWMTLTLTLTLTLSQPPLTATAPGRGDMDGERARRRRPRALVVERIGGQGSAIVCPSLRPRTTSTRVSVATPVSISTSLRRPSSSWM